MTANFVSPWLTTFLLGLSLSAYPVLGENINKDYCQGESDGIHPDPANCQGFYTCHGHRTFWNKCHSGTLYNPKTKSCDWERNVDCQDVPSVDTFCRDLNDGIHKNPEYSQRFYMCNAGITFSFTCPDRFFFNPKSGLCDWERNVDCSSTVITTTKPTRLPGKPTTLTPRTLTPRPTTFTPRTQTPRPTTFTPRTQTPRPTTFTPRTLTPRPTTVTPRTLTPRPTTFTPRTQTPRPTTFTPRTQTPRPTTFTPRTLTPRPTTVTPRTLTPRPTTFTSRTQTPRPTTATPRNQTPTTINSKLITAMATTKKSQPLTTDSRVGTDASKATTKDPGAQHGMGKRVVCYFTNWAQYRNGPGKHTPEDLDPHMCTHIVFAFAKLNGNQLAPYEWNDDQTDWDLGNYKRVTDLKKRNPNLKVLLAVGGWNMASAPFTSMVATQSSRKEFIHTSISFLRDRNFDGLDLDWEYPANRGSPLEDKDRFSSLLRELKAAYVQEGIATNRPRLSLTAAVGAGKSVVETAYDVPVLNSELDFINLMSYDLHGSWETQTGHNSPLYPGSWESGNDAMLNVHWAANNWIEKGASRENLVIGVPLYGRTFRLASSSNNSVGAEATGPGSAGTYTREQGFLSYYEICDMIKNGAMKEYIYEQRVPYVSSGDLWVGYDDPSSLREKVQYILSNNFGGVMAWDLSLDDAKGEFCGEGKYPLLAAINRAVSESPN